MLNVLKQNDGYRNKGTNEVKFRSCIIKNNIVKKMDEKKKRTLKFIIPSGIQKAKNIKFIWSIFIFLNSN